jgi:hypothetical protein
LGPEHPLRGKRLLRRPSPALLPALLLLLLAPVSGQEAAASGEPPQDSGVYVIRSIDFSRVGRSLPSALLYHGELKTGERLTGRRNLERYIQRKTQLLINQRTLEYAAIAYALGSPEEDGAIPVQLLVCTRDSFNFFIFPKPLISSNSGLDITLKARDYNFLGTMNPLRFDLGYALDYADRSAQKRRFTDGTFTVLLDSDIPVRLFDLDFNIDFDNEFKFTSNEPFYYKNWTGLSLELPVAFTTATLGFRQITTVNENNARVFEDSGYDPALHDEFERVFTYSELFVSWSFPTGVVVGEFGDLRYSPRLAGGINYRPGSPGWDPGDLRRGLTGSFSHSVGFERIDWIGNYRRGLSAHTGNDVAYNFRKAEWGMSWNAIVRGHLPLTSFSGISGRFKFDQIILGDTNTSAGEVLRGIIDRSVSADIMFSINLDFPLQALLFLPSRWFDKPALHFFDFELHISPILDAALRKPRTENRFIPEAAAGIEIIVFPFFIRQVFIRGSFALNLRDLIDTGRPGEYEYFVGLDHHY